MGAVNRKENLFMALIIIRGKKKMDLLAYVTPLLIVSVLLACLVIGAVIISSELETEFNSAFETINGEN